VRLRCFDRARTRAHGQHARASTRVPGQQECARASAVGRAVRTGALGRVLFLLALCGVWLGPSSEAALAQDPGGARPPSRPVPLTPRGERKTPPRRKTPEPAAPAAPEAPATPPPELPRFETGIDFNPPPTSERITFNLEDAELTDLVRLISSITGKAFIIPNKTRQVKATVYAPNKVSPAEAYRAFLSILELNGLSLVPSGRYLKIVESQGVENKTIPLLIDQNVPAEDRFVTTLVRINYVASEDVANLLGRFKSPEGNVTAYAPTNTVIITDTGSNIRRMTRIVKAIDVERGGEQLWIEPVHHATASDLAARLIEIFPLTAADGSAKGKPGQPAPAPPPGQPGKPSTVGTGAGGFRVTNILPDERTNSLVIMATESAYLRILELIRHLDVPLDGDGGIHVHYLQHGDAEEIAKTLTTLIGGTTKRNAGGAKPAGQPASPDAVFEGNIAVTAHEPTNSLVITSSLHDYAALKGVIDRLDSERRQVFIEAVVLNLDVTNSRTFGISYFTGIPNTPTEGSVAVAGYQNTAGNLVTGVQGLGSQVASAGGADALSGLALGIQGPAIQGISGLSIPSFGAALAAIASSGDSDVLATPHLLALNNEEAEISIGQNVPLQASVAGGLGGLGGMAGLAGLGGLAGATAGTGANPAAGLGALGGMGMGGFGAPPRGDVGTKIRVTPHINESDEIRLELEEEISDVGAPVAGSNVGAVPINRRTAKTQLVVRDQQTVVIGGLMRDAVTTTNSKIPLLGDIPVLGLLFRKKTTTKSKQNLLLFLTPYIVRSQADLRSIYERKQRERQEFLDRYFVFGSRDYHPAVDYARTRGLVSEIMKQVSMLQADNALAEKLAKEPTPEHVARQPVGFVAPASVDMEEGDVVVEGGASGAGAAPRPGPLPTLTPQQQQLQQQLQQPGAVTPPAGPAPPVAPAPPAPQAAPPAPQAAPPPQAEPAAAPPAGPQ
jgi:general secretion pathway protein D